MDSSLSGRSRTANAPSRRASERPRDASSSSGLKRTNHHRGWRGIKPTEQLEDPRACCTPISEVIHGQFQIDKGDIDSPGFDQLGCLAAGPGMHTLDTHGVEQIRQLCGFAAFSPSAGKQQVQASALLLGFDHGLVRSVSHIPQEPQLACRLRTIRAILPDSTQRLKSSIPGPSGLSPKEPL